MKIMEHPADLDEWESEQVAITRAIDEKHDGGNAFCNFMLGRLTLVKMATLPGGPLPFWQRAAYEAHVRAIRTGEVMDKHIAEALWAFTQYLQKEYEISERPESVEFIKKMLGESAGDFDFSADRD